MVTLYGIPNCNSVKKAENWLVQNGIEYNFYNYKKTGVSLTKLQAWCNQFGWQKILNKNGLTYKKLDTLTKTEITNQQTAINFMLTATSSIKRPILETQNQTILGFDAVEYATIFI